jgi:hypothetical protein
MFSSRKPAKKRSLKKTLRPTKKTVRKGMPTKRARLA